MQSTPTRRIGGTITLIAVLTSLAVAAMALPVAAADADPSADPTATSESGAIEWLFVQNAGSGTLDAAGDGSYQLVLSDVAEDTIAFTDTPHRTVRSMPTAEVVEAIDVATNTPNAALQIESPTPVTVILSLTDVTYDADAATLTYPAQVLGEGTLGDLTAEGDSPQGSFVDPVLFIDGEQVAETTDYLDLSIGVTCSVQYDIDTAQGGQRFCWEAKSGGENWPPTYSSISVTFKNTGTNGIGIVAGAPILQCALTLLKIHHVEPGDSVTLTFHHHNDICLGVDAKAKITTKTDTFSAEITAIEQND